MLAFLIISFFLCFNVSFALAQNNDTIESTLSQMINSGQKFIDLANENLNEANESNEANITGSLEFLEKSNTSLTDVVRFNSTAIDELKFSCKPTCGECGPGGGKCCGVKCTWG